MKELTVNEKSELKSVTHPMYGTIRYLESGGEKYVARADLQSASGFRSSSGAASLISEDHLIMVTLQYKAQVTNQMVFVSRAGVKEFMLGHRNLQRRSAVGQWLLERLWHERSVQMQLTPLDALNVDELAENVQERLDMDSLADKVLAKILPRLTVKVGVGP